MKTVIQVERVSKQYTLGVINHGMLYKDLQSLLARKLGRRDPNAPIGESPLARQGGKFWALRDVSFQVQEGERLGIIGRNGAGKSTLLKILSQVTAPTSGEIRVRGRIASLLEVGTGFHPELTGRENVYLNGAILGMKKAEIDRRFDEITSFSEIEGFIDTPVKRYSSGMYVRLAFSVAAHLDCEILLADEVLAVGDVVFQKKCIAKMLQVSRKEGRTVLYVSHNIGTILELCNAGLILEKGQIRSTSKNVRVQVGEYLENELVSSSLEEKHVEGLDRRITITAVSMDRKRTVPGVQDSICFSCTLSFSKNVSDARIGFTVGSLVGGPVGTGFTEDRISGREGEVMEVTVRTPPIPLSPGRYTVSISIGQGNDRTGLRDFDVVINALEFEVEPETDQGMAASWVSTWGPLMVKGTGLTVRRKTGAARK